MPSMDYPDMTIGFHKTLMKINGKYLQIVKVEIEKGLWE